MIGPTLGLSLVSCASAPKLEVMTAEQCARAEICKVRGSLEMSNDGHAYIGKLHLEDGSCVNVSLSEGQARRLSGQPAQMRTIIGKVFPYIQEDTLIEYRVNGRQIGYGLCGSYFVFVR
jgi:hypothetical protein